MLSRDNQQQFASSQGDRRQQLGNCSWMMVSALGSEPSLDPDLKGRVTSIYPNSLNIISLKVRPISPILLILVVILQHILAILVGSIRDLSGLRSRFLGSNMFDPSIFPHLSHSFPTWQRSCDCVLFSIFPRKSHPQVDR